MWLFEQKRKIRGIRFYFLVKPDIPKNEELLWKRDISQCDILREHYNKIDIGLEKSKEVSGATQIKIFCAYPKTVIRQKAVRSFYTDLFNEFNVWFGELCKKNTVSCNPLDFQLLFRIVPIEQPDDFIELESIESITKIFPRDKTQLPKTPHSPEDMMKLALTTADQLGEKGIDATCKWAEDEGLEIYVGYRLNPKKHFNTSELDVITQTRSSHVNPKGTLRGSLQYILRLEVRGKRDTSFDNAVFILITRLVNNQILSEQRALEIKSQLDKYIDETAPFVSSKDKLPAYTAFSLLFPIEEEVTDPQIDITQNPRLDIAKKEAQRDLKGTAYSVFGFMSYTLASEDFFHLDTIRRQISYFKNLNLDELFVDFGIIFENNSLPKSITLIKSFNHILSRSGITKKANMKYILTNIREAKTRYDNAVLEMKDKERLDATEVNARFKKGEWKYIYTMDRTSVPYEAFIKIFESPKQLSKTAEKYSILATLRTTDNRTQGGKYGCYLMSSRSMKEVGKNIKGFQSQTT